MSHFSNESHYFYKDWLFYNGFLNIQLWTLLICKVWIFVGIKYFKQNSPTVVFFHMQFGYYIGNSLEEENSESHSFIIESGSYCYIFIFMKSIKVYQNVFSKENSFFPKNLDEHVYSIKQQNHNFNY